MGWLVRDTLVYRVGNILGAGVAVIMRDQVCEKIGEIWDKLELEQREEVIGSFLRYPSQVERYGALYLQWCGVNRRARRRLVPAIIRFMERKGVGIHGTHHQ